MGVTSATLRERADLTTFRGDTTTAPRTKRIDSIDVVRGVVMILMAIDHVRVYSGVPAGGPTAGIFFTRWVTHFCAPAFAFFAGTSAFLYGRKLSDASALAKHLVQRGCILVALELTYLHVSWTFGVDYSNVLAGVIWMLGWCMIILAACVRMSPAKIGTIGVAFMALQTLMRPLAHAVPALQPLWQLLYLGGLVNVAGVNVIVLYNIVPWIGVMMAGYGFGAIVVRDAEARDRLCLRIGLAATAAFLIVGSALAAKGSNNVPFIFRLLAQSKYRDSQVFLLMTLGPAIALLALAGRARGWGARALATFGRVPMFYYLLHIPLIHALSLIVWKLRDGTAHTGWFATAPDVEVPAAQRWSLLLLYAVFAATIAILYPVCRWYMGFKARHSRSVRSVLLMPNQPPRTSRQRYAQFVEDYRHRRLDERVEEASAGKPIEEKPAAEPPTRRRGLRKLFRAGNRKQYTRDYLRWLKPHRRTVAIVFTLALVSAGLEMIEPLFLRFIVDKVLLNRALDMVGQLVRLHAAGLTFLAVVVISSLINVAKDYRQRILNVKLMLSLRRALYQRLLHLPLPKLWDMKTGGILSRISGDVETTTGLFQMAVLSPVLSLVRLIVAMVVLFTLNWRLALTAIAVVPGIMVLSFIFARRVRPIYRVVRKDSELIDGRVGETFGGIRVVRAFRREMAELLEFMRGRHTILRKELFAHRRELVLWTSWGFLLSAVNVVIVWYGGWLSIRGRASVGDIMAFQWYTMLLLNPVWNIVNSFSELQRSLAAMERVFEILGMSDDKPDRPNAVSAPRHVDEIRFEDVEFEYREGRPVVRDFNVSVRGGSVIALVGRSGAGKTTVTDLVARFHDPTRGRLLLNGTDIRDFRLRSYRDLLAIVQQDVFLFDGSVRENIAYGRHDASEEEILDAAKNANAHEFIVDLPDGYETFIGERGVKLSGGQQQRLAIARAFLKGPQILILDEATSNLDTESEQLIQASMAALLAGRTTFVIAHRLSTVRRADLILVMEDGRVIERGTHVELMAARGTYYTMVMRQMEAAEARETGDGSWALGVT